MDLIYHRQVIYVKYVLTHALGSEQCIALNSNVRIKIQAAEKYVYPDASVTCDEQDRQAPQFINHPSLIVEVLSPNTEAYDSSTKTLRERGKKFKLYQRSTSLIEYILVSAEEMEIEIFRKNDRGKWEVTGYNAGEVVELESINLTFPIERVYQGIQF